MERPTGGWSMTNWPVMSSDRRRGERSAFHNRTRSSGLTRRDGMSAMHEELAAQVLAGTAYGMRGSSVERILARDLQALVAELAAVREERDEWERTARAESDGLMMWREKTYRVRQKHADVGRELAVAQQALREIQGMAGYPDAAQACRNIIAAARAALEGGERAVCDGSAECSALRHRFGCKHRQSVTRTATAADTEEDGAWGPDHPKYDEMGQ